jgi:hypothetical protein
MVQQVWGSQFTIKHVKCANNMGNYILLGLEWIFLYCGVFKVKHGTLNQYCYNNKVKGLGHKNTFNLEGTHIWPHNKLRWIIVDLCC